MDKNQMPELTLVKLRRSSQITLPLGLRKAAKLKDGDYLEAGLTKDGILLRPVTVRARYQNRADDALIQSVVDEVRREYAHKRRP